MHRLNVDAASTFSRRFLKIVLSMCEVEEIVLDRGPWYRDAICRLGVKVRYESFGDRSLVESVFSSFKQRAKIFFCSITVNFKRKDKKLSSLRWSRAIECWNKLCKMFIFYYILRGGDDVIRTRPYETPPDFNSKSYGYTLDLWRYLQKMSSEMCTVCGLPKELCICEEVAKEQQRIVVKIHKRKIRQGGHSHSGHRST